MPDLRDDAFEIFEEYVTGEGFIEGITELLAEEIAKGITGLTRDQVMRIAREQAAKLVKDISEGTRKGLAEIIAQGLENQIGIDGIKRNIRDQIGLDPQRIASVNNYREELEKQGLPQSEIDRLVEKFTEEQIANRAETIARTEARAATEAAEAEVMIERGARFKASISVGDDVVSDICQANESEGFISVEEDFSSGDSHPPFHPNCRCVVAYRDEVTPEAEERARSRAEKTAEAKNSDE